MKKNRMMRLAAFLLVCVLLTTSLISGTYAKYVSTATATDTAKVAKWQINVGTVNIAQADTQVITFGLFDTINDTDGSGEEKHVSAGLIAPGTKGAFDVTITNNSEVHANIKAALSAKETNGDIPIQYSVDGTTWKANLADLSVDENLAPGASAEVKVLWQWVYEVDKAGDTADTLLGIAAASGTAPAVEVTMAVTATQID